MPRLFLRIFLSVLLAMLLALAGGVAVSIWFGLGPGPGAPPYLGPRERQRSQMHAIAGVLEEEGAEAAARELDAWGAPPELRPFLLDEQGADLRGRNVPPQVAEAARRALSRDPESSETGRRDRGRARTLTAPDGRRYVLIAERREPRPRRGGSPIWGLAVRLTITITAVGIVCFLLARYMASPVLKLRAATRRFADGDLEQRVVPAIGKRRDELGDLAADFDDMAGRIGELLSAQQRLIRDVSHELRSPLARLTVALGLARQRSGAEAAGALDRIETEAERLNELIEHVLTLSRLENDIGGVERETLDLQALVAQVVEDADFEARGAGKSVRVTATTACSVLGVGKVLRSAIENVVRNAVRHTPSDTTVAVALEVEAGEAVVRVRDHGPGAPHDALDAIFRPFYRVADARDRESGGAGLGLAITARALQFHGGSATAHNASDGGLIVVMRLPIQQ